MVADPMLAETLQVKIEHRSLSVSDASPWYWKIVPADSPNAVARWLRLGRVKSQT